jgi:hypothetical protein
MITANGVPPLRGSGTTTSSANGSFTITNLPPGKYELCAQVGNAGYLDPCAWQFMPVTAQVPAGALTGYQLVVKLGTPLQVRINDPAGILTASVSPTSAAPSAIPTAAGSGLLVGVVSTRGFLQARPPLAWIQEEATDKGHITLAPVVVSVVVAPKPMIPTSSAFRPTALCINFLTSALASARLIWSVRASV